MYVCKADFRMYHTAASLIQAMWRGRRTRTYVGGMQEAGMRLKKWWVGKWSRVKFLRLRGKAVKIQAMWRGELARQRQALLNFAARYVRGGGAGVHEQSTGVFVFVVFVRLCV